MPLLLDPRIAREIHLSFALPDGEFTPTRAILVALGKSALFMTERFLERHPALTAVPLLIVVPEGVPSDATTLPADATLISSTHPHLTEKSFAAGEALVRFIARHDADHIISLLSGGASALVEQGDDPAGMIRDHRALLHAGLPIAEMNRRRIARSGIKGGKLTHLRPDARWTTFVMSDIPAPDGYRLVGSMPTGRDGEPRHRLVPVADDNALHERYAVELRRHGYRIVAEERFFTGTVEDWAHRIATQKLAPGEALLITGEPTLAVTIPDPGIGGRMGHLALLLADELDEGMTLHAFSSDGIDGNSPYAGVIFTPEERCRFDRSLIPDHLARFDAYSFFERYGCAVTTGYTGVNLNDVVVVSRD